MSYLELIRYVVLFTLSHGDNRNQQRGGGGGGGCHFDVESGTFKGKFGTLMWPSGTLMLPFNTFFFAKIPFRLRIVLSRLFVSKILHEVCNTPQFGCLNCKTALITIQRGEIRFIIHILAKL